MGQAIEEGAEQDAPPVSLSAAVTHFGLGLPNSGYRSESFHSSNGGFPQGK